jgi:hypothetical protein
VDQRIGFTGKGYVRDVAGGFTAEEKKIAGPHGFERDGATVKDLLGGIPWETHPPRGEGGLDQARAVDTPRGYPTPLIGTAREVLERPAFWSLGARRERELFQRSYSAGENPTTPAIGKYDRISLELEARPEREWLPDLPNADRRAFTPRRRTLTPLVDLLLAFLAEISGMRPAVVAVDVSADPAPFSVQVGDRCSLSQHQLSHLLGPDPWLREDRGDCRAGDCRSGDCRGHHNLGLTGSFPLLLWMHILDKV